MKSSRISRWWIGIIGLGLALLPIHNKWFTDLLTNSKGETLFFLPAFGYLLLLMGTGMFLLYNWEQVKSNGWGDRRVVIPLLIIVLFLGISGFLTGDSVSAKFAPLLMGISLFAVYVAARNLGSDIFRALTPFVVLGAIVSITLGVLNPGIPAAYTNGLITNYCAAVGFLLLGAVVNQGKWQWVILTVALIGVFFIGAIESLFVLVALGTAVIVRRDISKRLLITVGSIVLLIGLWAVLGHLWALYRGNGNLQALLRLVTSSAPLRPSDQALRELTSGRWEIIVKAMRDIRFFGHGLALGTVGGGIVHNIPLIIVHQIGPIAGLAWLFVTVFCLIKTKWKYAWIAVLAMSVWDHYLWTQFLPWWWALIGVSTASTIKSDLIFRRGNNE